MWVPCVPSRCKCRMACASGIWCSCATSCKPSKRAHQATRPVACICRSAACSGHCSCLPCPFAQSRLHKRAAAPSTHIAAGVGGAYRQHCRHNITLIIMAIIGRYAPMRLLWALQNRHLCNLIQLQVPSQQPADWHSASGVVGAGWLIRCHVGTVHAAHPRVPPCCVHQLGMCVRHLVQLCLQLQAKQEGSIMPPGQLHAFADQLPAAAIAAACHVPVQSRLH
jgi:hypothetical protein